MLFFFAFIDPKDGSEGMHAFDASSEFAAERMARKKLVGYRDVRLIGTMDAGTLLSIADNSIDFEEKEDEEEGEAIGIFNVVSALQYASHEFAAVIGKEKARALRAAARMIENDFVEKIGL